MISAKEYTSAARVRMPLSRTSWETAVSCYAAETSKVSCVYWDLKD